MTEVYLGEATPLLIDEEEEEERDEEEVEISSLFHRVWQHRLRLTLTGTKMAAAAAAANLWHG